MARDTSFYYAFLMLPPAKRNAIVAVWDFCRAVDDAVDEVGAGRRVAADAPRRATGRARAGGLARRARALLRRDRRPLPQTRRAARCSRSSRRSGCRGSRSRI